MELKQTEKHVKLRWGHPGKYPGLLINAIKQRSALIRGRRREAKAKREQRKKVFLSESMPS
jgi:hypothetical protein